MNKKVKNQSEALRHKRYREGKKEKRTRNDEAFQRRIRESPATEETPTDPLLLQNVLESMVLEGVTKAYIAYLGGLH